MLDVQFTSGKWNVPVLYRVKHSCTVGGDDRCELTLAVVNRCFLLINRLCYPGNNCENCGSLLYTCVLFTDRRGYLINIGFSSCSHSFIHSDFKALVANKLINVYSFDISV